jgi:hypothetical protein
LRRLTLAVCILCLSLTVLSATLRPSPARAEGWHRVSDDDGVNVDVRDITGQDFPEFRGSVVIKSSIFELLAIIGDLSRVCQWTARCIDSRELSRKTEFDRIFYSRTDSPWPVSDRDAVLHAYLVGNLSEGKDLSIKFDHVTSPLMPPIKGIVRMPQLNGAYHLVSLGPESTRVEFAVHLDPGGLVPSFIVRSMSKGVPRDTLIGLRRQAGRMRGKYEEYVKRWTGQTEPSAKTP